MLGEIIFTAGILAMLYPVWQLWWNDQIMANSQQNAAAAQALQWERQPRTVDAPLAPRAEIPTETAPHHGAPFGVLYVPRFGTGYHRVIAEGIDHSVLNSPLSGIGHYPSSQMPGQVGNFAIASHRSANGGGLHIIQDLQLGDAIVIQTKNGWYTYRFRNFTYVQPRQSDAVAPVPGHPGAAAQDRLITMTTCNPLYSTAERIIAYGVFESFQPTTKGPPASLNDTQFAGPKEP